MSATLVDRDVQLQHVWKLGDKFNIFLVLPKYANSETASQMNADTRNRGATIIKA
jgi:hypothetical protein